MATPAKDSTARSGSAVDDARGVAEAAARGRPVWKWNSPRGCTATSRYLSRTSARRASASITTSSLMSHAPRGSVRGLPRRLLVSDGVQTRWRLRVRRFGWRPSCRTSRPRWAASGDASRHVTSATVGSTGGRGDSPPTTAWNQRWGTRSRAWLAARGMRRAGRASASGRRPTRALGLTGKGRPVRCGRSIS